MTHDQILTAAERKNQVWALKFEKEHATLRALLVEKYTEVGVVAVEDKINEKDQRQERR